VPLPGFLNSISQETLLVLAAYVVLGGAYLVAVPLALYAWMVKRWTVMGKLERLGVYGLVFLFFPGLILFAPFINLRMAGHSEVT
jgi:NAD(P)H-quinone oxidoreductase subunit L